MALSIGITPQRFDNWAAVMDKAMTTGVYQPSVFIADDGRIIGDSAEGAVVLGLWGGAPGVAPSGPYDVPQQQQIAHDGFVLPDWVRQLQALLQKALRDFANMLGVSSLIAMLILLVGILLFFIIFRD